MSVRKLFKKLSREPSNPEGQPPKSNLRRINTNSSDGTFIEDDECISRPPRMHRQKLLVPLEDAELIKRMLIDKMQSRYVGVERQIYLDDSKGSMLNGSLAAAEGSTVVRLCWNHRRNNGAPRIEQRVHHRALAAEVTTKDISPELFEKIVRRISGIKQPQSEETNESAEEKLFPGLKPMLYVQFKRSMFRKVTEEDELSVSIRMDEEIFVLPSPNLSSLMKERGGDAGNVQQEGVLLPYAIITVHKGIDPASEALCNPIAELPSLKQVQHGACKLTSGYVNLSGKNSPRQTEACLLDCPRSWNEVLDNILKEMDEDEDEEDFFDMATVSMSPSGGSGSSGWRVPIEDSEEMDDSERRGQKMPRRNSIRKSMKGAMGDILTLLRTLSPSLKRRRSSNSLRDNKRSLCRLSSVVGE